MPRLIAGCVLLGLGALICLGNWTLVVSWIRSRKGGSMVPLGGPLAFAGCALVPAIGWKHGLAALALDPLTVCLAIWPIVACGQLVWRRARRGG